MDNEVSGGATVDANSDPVADQSTSNTEPEAAAPVTEPKQAPAEKMVPSSQVSKIVAQQAREAADRARREAYAEFERQKGEAAQAGSSSGSVGGIDTPNDEKIRQMIQQEAYRMSNQAMAERIASDFEAKMDAVRAQDPEFDNKLKALNIEQHPELVLWTREMDNVGDVMKDIVDNPTKFAQILTLANSGFSSLAQQELNKLSASIKANEAAKSAPKAPEPLSQINSSNIGTDNGELSVSDFMKQPWLRG